MEAENQTQSGLQQQEGAPSAAVEDPSGTRSGCNIGERLTKMLLQHILKMYAKLTDLVVRGRLIG